MNLASFTSCPCLSTSPAVPLLLPPPQVPIIEGAGGKVTDWRGQPLRWPAGSQASGRERPRLGHSQQCLCCLAYAAASCGCYRLLQLKKPAGRRLQTRRAQGCHAAHACALHRCCRAMSRHAAARCWLQAMHRRISRRWSCWDGSSWTSPACDATDTCRPDCSHPCTPDRICLPRRSATCCPAAGAIVLAFHNFEEQTPVPASPDSLGTVKTACAAGRFGG